MTTCYLCGRETDWPPCAECECLPHAAPLVEAKPDGVFVAVVGIVCIAAVLILLAMVGKGVGL